jgi:hypothetical protein
MEPHREDQPKVLEPSAERKLKRFRVVKLEERIAPTQPLTNGGLCLTGGRTCFCNASHPCGSAQGY